jgi:hypothetical protein
MDSDANPETRQERQPDLPTSSMEFLHQRHTWQRQATMQSGLNVFWENGAEESKSRTLGQTSLTIDLHHAPFEPVMITRSAGVLRSAIIVR